MNYDLATNKKKYKGCERSVSCYDFDRYPKKKFNFLFEINEKFMEELVIPYSDHITEEGLEKLLYYYRIYRENDVDCEVIVFDKEPINEAIFPYKTELLGIDIVDECFESLLEGCEPYDNISKYLNGNMLCDSVDVIPDILSRVETGYKQWGPCWVYRLVIVI